MKNGSKRLIPVSFRKGIISLFFKLYRSRIGRLVWAVFMSAWQHIDSFSNSRQTSKANDAMVEMRNSVDVALLARSLNDLKREWPVITLSVVTYNNGRWLQQFLDSLILQDYPLNKIHLIFVDNTSSDDTLKLLSTAKEKYSGLFEQFSIITHENLGFGAGHDIAIQSTSTEYVLVSNIDLEFAPNSLTRVMASAIDDPEAASWELRQIPYEHPKFVDPVSLCVNWSSHACILLSREKYLQVGGYEKRIFMYGEDVELSYRFRRSGYLLKYVPSAIVKHYSYKEEKEVKPLQIQGNVLANYFIRLRYGNIFDILGGILLFFAAIIKGAGFKGSRMLFLNLLPKAFVNTPAFILSRKSSAASFPFHRFDYDLVRDGAFYEVVMPAFADKLPLITIVTRTVEGRKALLKQCMLSVINQTYPNIEHLVVEDGGNSAESLIRSFQEKELSGYSLYHIACDKNGRSSAANRGMASAEGKYIVLLDDDDLLFPDHIEILYQAITQAKVDAAYSLAWEVATNYLDKVQGTYREYSHITRPIFHQPFDRDLLKHRNYLPIQSVLFKKSLFESYGGFNEDISQLEDWVLWKKYALNSEFLFVPKTTSLYKTPMDIRDMMMRKKLLDTAYDEAHKISTT